ncbi:MAG: EAL domain-containing protein [Actinomycetota bacterium]|jgi:EAL domain-containing protein (putative c-di-GMP-specific phosphodiesterase class I)|nr:EAL domain-containing protein [Actinomycetota bacterium]
MTTPPTLVLTGEPLVEYQPAVDLATGRLIGFEALVRWNHPTRGHIPPEILIPWAESSDDIVTLNAWVIEQACEVASTWPSGLQIAVNCSNVQLHQRQASKAVSSALEMSGLNPDRLTVEITERAAADDDASADLRDLAALGVHLAVDDVGTSWSSLQPLKQLDVEIVKIDRAFVNSLEPTEGMNRAIVEAIIHVSHSLNMSTVAEGVESANQAAILREFGADAAQGFYYCPPVPVQRACDLASAEPRPILPAALSSKPRGGYAPIRGLAAPRSGGSALLPPGAISTSHHSSIGELALGGALPPAGSSAHGAVVRTPGEAAAGKTDVAARSTVDVAARSTVDVAAVAANGSSPSKRARAPRSRAQSARRAGRKDAAAGDDAATGTFAPDAPRGRAKSKDTPRN